MMSARSSSDVMGSLQWKQIIAGIVGRAAVMLSEPAYAPDAVTGSVRPAARGDADTQGNALREHVRHFPARRSRHHRGRSRSLVDDSGDGGWWPVARLPGDPVEP